jgi:hypothetical protein
MTDEQSPDSDSTDSNNGAAASGNADQDLDAALAEAASLSAALSAGVGDTENQTKEDQVEPAASQADEVARNLDAELAEMEQLLETSSSDLGAESPEEEGEPAASAPATQETPAFMAEFTQPEPGGDEQRPSTPSAPDEPTARAGTPPNVGVVGTGKIGVVGQGGSAAPQTRPIPPGPGPTPLAESFEETHTEPKSNPLRSITDRLSTVVLPACEHCTRLLEILDKPTGGVSKEARRIIGWIALATLGTAVFVFLTPLF